jgi:hypothetical protein
MRNHFTLAFDCDNAAFDPPTPSDEIVRILCEVAEKVRQGSHAGSIRDVNGNLIGQWEWRS